MEMEPYANDIEFIRQLPRIYEEFKASELAVDIKDIEFEYRNNESILNGLSLTIPKGKIFALLGPNGVGKTTIMRLILGQLKFKKGSLKVFGVSPGSVYSNIPGSGVGYMPQELALFDEFTISEILIYYGTIYELEKEELDRRIDHLMDLLSLPEKSRIISRLSGGQRRRVSIAITLIHRPKLIILDEPTVGVDSMLRHRIWEHLESICRLHGQTVIITTHYIEEAKSAANIAFINFGTILRQSNPQKLLTEYNCETLEEIFLILCQKQNIYRDTERKDNDCENSIESKDKYNYSANEISLQMPRKRMNKKFLNYNHIKAMLWRYYIIAERKPMSLLLLYFIPFIILTYLHYLFGKDLRNISIAVYNGDANGMLSKLFLDSINKNSFKITEYPTNESAIQSVVDGINHMSLMLAQNYSQSLEERFNYIHDVDHQEIYESDIHLYVDFSIGTIAIFLLRNTLHAMDKLLSHLSTRLGLNLNGYLNPIVTEEVIYGDLDINLALYYAPGMILGIVHLLPAIISGFHIVTERQNVSFERVFVAGVKPIEYFIAQLLINILLISSQVIAIIIMAFVIYDFTQLGSYYEVFLLLFLQALQGMALGLLVALVLSDVISFTIAMGGIAFPLWIASGVLWPLESVPNYFRFITDLSPVTQPLLALRAIMTRGWDYTRLTVLYGFAVNISYITILTILDVIIFIKFPGGIFSIYSLN